MSAEPRGYPPFDVPKRVADGLWIVDAKPIRAMGLALPVRMTVVRLTDGRLWLHSPTRFSPELHARLEEFGPVSHLVAPTIGHWTFLKAWQRQCPGTTSWAAPNLRRRLQVRASGVRFDHDLGDAPPDAWSSDLRQTIVPGGGGYREAAFFHTSSRTVLLADLVSNLEPDRVPPATRLYARLTGTRAPNGSTPTYLRATLLLRRRDAAAACARLVEWKPERAVFAHGRWFETDGARELKRALAWLLDRR